MLIAQLIMLNLLFIAAFSLLYPHHPVLFGTVSILLFGLLIKILARANQKYQKLKDMLEGGFRSLQDGDFAISLPYTQNSQDNTLIDLFNQTTEKLRAEKQSLFQRELLLDKVVNASDVVTVLVNHRGTAIFANIAAFNFFQTRRLVGANFLEIVKTVKPELNEHQLKNNAIIQLPDVERSDYLQSWHLSRHSLRLHGSSHQLILLKPMTKELHDQELKTWKKVIRVINHELNNSIAPISSMCTSGKILAEKLEQPQLDRVFNTISNRIQKLSEFIQNYSQLARLSKPHKQPFDLLHTLQQMQPLYHFELNTTDSVLMITADASQLEQLLINLLKNANEICPEEPCSVTIASDTKELVLTVRDHGPGMSSDVMQKAFLPYYSTKEQGSGIGLSICKEVVDAHDGHIELNNHPTGGLEVRLAIPLS